MNNYGFINTKEERLRPIWHLLMEKLNIHGFDNNTQVPFKTAAEFAYDLAMSSKVEITAEYVISKDQFISFNGYMQLEMNIGTLASVSGTLNIWKRLKLAYRVFKAIK